MWRVTEYIVVSNNAVGKSIVLKKKIKVLISGKVIDSNCRKICGAIMKLEKLDYNYIPCKVIVLGYTISDCNGRYAILVDKIAYVDYRLSIYQSIIKNNI